MNDGRLSVEDARACIARELEPVRETERVPLRDALGRVLARDVFAPFHVPPHTNSAMDGYAIAHADLLLEPSRAFAVVGTAWAGRPYKGAARTGQAIRIMTGSVMPPGTDTVIMREHTREGGDTVSLDPGRAAGYAEGQNVRAAGEDLARGTLVLGAGRRIVPADLGLLASLGIAEAEIYRRVRVAFFCTGDELRSLGEPLGEGEIYDSNRYTLYGMLSRLGVRIEDLGVVPDRIDALREAFARASGIADVVIATGGVSVGEADHVGTVLREEGQVHFRKIAMKPGHPLTFGRIGRARFFGLPGNPVAVMASFYQFVRFALARVAGETDPRDPPAQRAVCVSRIPKKTGRTEFVRGVLETGADGRPTVRKTGAQGSGILHSMSLADCFIVLLEEQGDVAPGDEVSIQVFRGVI